MHQLLRIVVPEDEVFSLDDIDDEDAEAQFAEEANGMAKLYVEDSISMHSRGAGGFADWHEDHAGRWAEEKNAEYGDDNLYQQVEDDPSTVVLTGDAARSEVEEAWESTRGAYEQSMSNARKELIDVDINPSKFFEQDIMELRESSMLKHYLHHAFGYAPENDCYGYITGLYTPIDTPSRKNLALELIEDGAAVVLIDVHY